MTYNLLMVAFLVWYFSINITSIHCCASDAYVYPISCQMNADGVKETNVGISV